MVDIKKDKYPLVSVIIPTYNREKFLYRAIQSVLKQTFKNFEIIIVDDGSRDGTKKIIENFHDSRINYILNQKNRGGAAARNIGINASCGKYIAFLDDDDEWLPQKIEKQIGLIQKIGNCTNNILVYSKSIIYKRFSKKIVPVRGIKPFEKISDYLFVFNGYIPTPSILVNIELAKACLFNEKLNRHQDFDFLYKVEKKGAKIFFIDTPLVIIHKEYENQIMEKWSPEITENFIKEYRDFFSDRSYWNFLFRQLVIVSATNISKFYSIKKFFKINLKYITIRNLMIFSYRIFFKDIISGILYFFKNVKVVFSKKYFYKR